MITTNYTYQAQYCEFLTASERIEGLKAKHHALTQFEFSPEVQSSLQGRNQAFNLLSATTSKKHQNAFFPYYDGIDVEHTYLLANLLISLDRLSPLELSIEWKDYCLQQYTTPFSANERIINEMTGDYNPNLSALLLLMKIARFLGYNPDRHPLAVSFLKSFDEPLLILHSTFDPRYIRDVLSINLRKLTMEANTFSKAFMISQIPCQRRHLEYGHILQTYNAVKAKHRELFLSGLFNDRSLSFNLSLFHCSESPFFNEDDFEYQKSLSTLFSELSRFIDGSLNQLVKSNLFECKKALFSYFYDTSLFYQKTFQIENETAVFLTVATRILQHTFDMGYPFNQSFMEYIKEGLNHSDDSAFQNGITLLCQFYISNVQAFLVS